MCVMRHSAARPNRIPAVRIKPARRQPFGYDWKIRAATDADGLGPGGADAWTSVTLCPGRERWAQTLRTVAVSLFSVDFEARPSALDESAVARTFGTPLASLVLTRSGRLAAASK